MCDWTFLVELVQDTQSHKKAALVLVSHAYA